MAKTQLLPLFVHATHKNNKANASFFPRIHPTLLRVSRGASAVLAKIDQLKAWANQTTAAFSLQMLKGDHFFLHSAQSQLLQCITQQLQSLARITTS